MRENPVWVVPVVVGGLEKGCRWTKTDRAASVHVIRQIDQQATKEDIFGTMKGIKRLLRGRSGKGSYSN